MTRKLIGTCMLFISKEIEKNKEKVKDLWDNLEDIGVDIYHAVGELWDVIIEFFK